jgi:hypothetical protein
MKTLRKFTCSLAMIFLSMGAFVAHGQEMFYYSGPASGYIQAALGQIGVNEGSISTGFGAINETIQFDPVANTMLDTGTITLTSDTGSFVMNGNPDPIGTATVTVGVDGTIPFSFTATLGAGSGVFLGVIEVPVSGFGTDQGQPFSGSWTLGLGVETVITASSASSIGIEQIQDMGVSPTIEMEVVNGLYDGTQGGWGESLSVQGTATAVPEPELAWVSGLLLTAAGLGSKSLRRRLSI